MKMKMMSKCIFVPKSCVSYFSYFLHFFHFELFYFPLPIKAITLKKPKHSLIKSPHQQGAGPINTGTKGILLGNHGCRNEEPNVSSQSPSSVESWSRSQPQLKTSPGQISQACPQ